MSFVVSTATPNIPAFDYTADASVAFTTGKVGYRDTSTGEIKEDAGGNEADTIRIECVIAKSETTTAAYPTIRAIPIVNGVTQLWIADCTSATAANQLNKAHALTSATHVANTSSHINDKTGVFVALKIVGAIGGTQLLGYFVKLGQAVS